MGVQDDYEHNLQFLIDAGYTKDNARKALEVTQNNLSSAFDYLMSPPASSSNAVVAVDPKGDDLGKALEESLKSAVKKPDATADDLKRAIDASLATTKEKEDMELQKALQMSMTGPQPMDIDNSGAPKISDEDRLMAQAIEQSLQTASGGSISSSTPASMKREPGVCYVNSLLQTYFMLPALRNAVLSFVPPPMPTSTTPAPTTAPVVSAAPDGASSDLTAPPNSPRGSDPMDTVKPAPTTGTADAPIQVPDEPPKNSDLDSIEFMIELQRLFANLILSSQKYVDPSHMLKKLKDKSGNTLKIGNQEDAVEFNDLFLETIQRGLNLGSKPVEGLPSSDFIKNMFYGNSVQIISGKEEDTTPFEIKSDSIFNHLILRVGKELPDLFASLDAQVCDTLDYTTEKGFKTKAASTTWFKRTPPILMFQQSRVGFDPEKKTFTKSFAPLNFEKEIYLDRYMIENQEETARIRGIVNAWREELARHEEELRGFTHYDGDCGLDQALRAMIRYYQAKKDNQYSPHHSSIITELQRDLEVESGRMKALRDRIGSLRSQIITAYDHMKSTPYVLYGVWVHQGVAGSGHYWAFLTEPRNSKWMRFNDMRVSEVKEEEVFTESVGGHANSSAYFLIYLEKSMLNQVPNMPDIFQYLPEETPVPDNLKVEIEESNKKFQESLESAEKDTTETKVKKFVEKYQEKLADVQKKLQEGSYQHDYTIKSFWVFLLKQQQLETVCSDIVRQIYSVHFEKGIQMDIDSAAYIGVQGTVGAEVLQGALAMSVDTAKVDGFKRQHQIYQQVVQFCCSGLSMMMDDRYQAAVEYIQWAKLKDDELPPSVKREQEIINFARILFLKMLGSLKKELITTGTISNNSFTVLGYMPQFPGHNDQVTRYVAAELSHMSKQRIPGPAAQALVLVSNIIMMEQKLQPQKAPPPPAAMQPDEETALMDRYGEVMARLETNAKEPIMQLIVMGLLPERLNQESAQQSTDHT